MATLEPERHKPGSDQSLHLEKGSRNDLLVHLFNEHYDSLVRLASFLLDDIPSCEEVVQDAFVKMQTITKPPEEGKEAAYLRAIVLNNTRSRMRKRAIKRKTLLDVASPFPAAEHETVQKYEKDRIISELRQLPKRQSEVLILRYYMDLPEADIAKTLKISVGSVKTHASRGLKAMGKNLGIQKDGPGAVEGPKKSPKSGGDV